MTPHDRAHEELLSAHLAAARADAREVPAALRDCPACRAAWERLRAAPASLTAAAAHRREILAEAARDEAAPGEERLLATLERLAGPPRAAPRPQRRRVWLAAAAVVLLAAAWFAWRSRSSDPARAPVWLGDAAFERLAPAGEVPSFESFAWTYNGPATSFELWIHRDEDGQRGETIEHVTCEQASWTPDADALARWPRKIQWRVVARDALGDELGSASAWASRP